MVVLLEIKQEFPVHPEREESLRTPQAALSPLSTLPTRPNPSGLESSITKEARKTPEIIRRQNIG